MDLTAGLTNHIHPVGNTDWRHIHARPQMWALRMEDSPQCNHGWVLYGKLKWGEKKGGTVELDTKPRDGCDTKKETGLLLTVFCSHFWFLMRAVRVSSHFTLSPFYLSPFLFYLNCSLLLKTLRHPDRKETSVTRGGGIVKCSQDLYFPCLCSWTCDKHAADRIYYMQMLHAASMCIQMECFINRFTDSQ